MLTQKILQGSFKTLLFVACFVLIYLFFGLVYTLYYLPIYPDEIAIRVWLSRAIYDFPLHINVLPSGANYLLRMPIIWYVPGFIEWLLHGLITNLQTLRDVGLLIYLGMVAVLAHILTEKMQKPLLFKTLVGLSVVISLLALGVLPAFFVTNRPEQILLVCLIIIFMIEKHVRTHPEQEISFSILLTFLICVSMMLYVHPKALYLSPLFFLVALRFVLHSPKRISTYLVIALLPILIICNLHEWQKELQFDPSVKQYMDSFNIQPDTLIKNSSLFFSQLHQSISDSNELFIKMGFQKHTDIDYLPPVQLKIHDVEMNRFIDLNCVILFFSLLGYLFYRFISDCKRNNFLSVNLFFLLVLGSIVIGSLLNLTKTWYDVGYFWAVIMIIGIFSLTDHMNAITKNVFGIAFLIYFIACTIFSLNLFRLNYAKAILQGYAGPSVPLINFDYKDYKSMVKLAAKKCLLNPKQNHGLVLDDYTYLYFKKFKNPMLITYINNHTATNKFPELIKENKMTAIIIRCTYLPIIPGVRSPSVLRFDNICCYPQNRIQELLV